LDYQEKVSYIVITIYDPRLIEILNGKAGIKINDIGEIDIEIHDREDIEKIIKYLNSLKLIEDNLIEYVPFDRNNVGFFEIFIFRDGFENDSDAVDIIAFETNYLAFIPNGHDWKETRYYIKNSGYNHKTKTSKTFNFLYDLINK